MAISVSILGINSLVFRVLSYYHRFASSLTTSIQWVPVENDTWVGLVAHVTTPSF